MKRAMLLAACVAACASPPPAGGGGGGGGASSSGGGGTSSSGGGGASSSGGGTSSSGGGGTSSNGGGGTSSSGGGGASSSGGGTSASGGGSASCQLFTAQATQPNAALMVVLDFDARMSGNSVLAMTEQGIVEALDTDAFDHQTVGLMTFPSSNVTGPACVFNFPVACGFPMQPQVALQDAASAKSTANGVRKSISQYLTANSPVSASDSSAPGYAALSSAYAALQATSSPSRGVILITLGSFGCGSLAAPARPYYSDSNGCPDWEQPPVVSALILNARTDAQKPVRTVIIGVPGSNSTGAMVGGFTTAPYSVELALSTYAVVGAPDTVNPSCDANLVFTQGGGAPATPCHLDLSNSGSFNAQALAQSIGVARQQLAGCTYDLPMGQTIPDAGVVNVDLTANGVKTPLLKRVSSSDLCTSDGCWDYDSQGRVVLLGAACANLAEVADGRVDVHVGCATMTK